MLDPITLISLLMLHSLVFLLLNGGSKGRGGMALCCLVLLSPSSHSQGGIHAVVTGTKWMQELEATAASDLSCYHLPSPALVSCCPWEDHIHGWHTTLRKVCCVLPHQILRSLRSKLTEVVVWWISTWVHLCEWKKTTRVHLREHQLVMLCDSLGNTVTLPFWLQTFEEIINQIRSLANC